MNKNKHKKQEKVVDCRLQGLDTEKVLSTVSNVSIERINSVFRVKPCSRISVDSYSKSSSSFQNKTLKHTTIWRNIRKQKY